MNSINDIFRDFAPDYLHRFGETMPAQHKKVIEAMVDCRTEVNGSLVYRCERCGRDHLLHRGCGNRHCPGCQHHRNRRWMEKQLERQLPGHHFMLTFTVPEPLRDFIRSHQRSAYAALFAASSQAIKVLATNPRFNEGDLPGFFGVLHTWGRMLQYHPHIHYVVPGGMLACQTGQWHPTAPQFYLPVAALSKIFRAKFRDRMHQDGLLNQIPAEVWKCDWNVNSQAVGCPEAAIKYLTPYVFQVAISNTRIVKVEDGKVFFRYKKSGSNRPRTMALDALEFIRRFLQHVLPTGFMKVRYYGFLNPNSKVPLEKVRTLVELAYGFVLNEPKMDKKTMPSFLCPHCKGELVYCYAILPHRQWAGGPSG